MSTAPMGAVVYRQYGSRDQLELERVRIPVARRHEIQVRVHRAALNPKDSLLRQGEFRPLSGRRFPKLLGLDFAGEVIASRDAGYRVGERVFGFLNEWRGRRGALADVVCARPSELARLPAQVSMEQGAAVALVGTTCLQALRDLAHVAPGHEVLIHGASGGVGTAAIQIARLLGARVTTLSSAKNRELCTRLGASRACSYEALDTIDLTPFRCVFDVHGSLSGPTLRKTLKPGAIFISTTPTPNRLLRNVLTRASAIQERLVLVSANASDLTQLADWLATGQLQAVIDARFPLQEVRAAFSRLETRHACGKVIIDVADDAGPLHEA